MNLFKSKPKRATPTKQSEDAPSSSISVAEQRKRIQALQFREWRLQNEQEQRKSRLTAAGSLSALGTLLLSTAASSAAYCKPALSGSGGLVIGAIVTCVGIALGIYAYFS